MNVQTLLRALHVFCARQMRLSKRGRRARCRRMLSRDTDMSRVIVPLGPSCLTAQLLRVADMRSVAYPLDWLFSCKTSGVIQALGENGGRHADVKHLCAYTDRGSGGSARTLGVLNLVYDFHMMHDGSKAQDDAETCAGAARTAMLTDASIRAKYERRWLRLRNALATPNACVHVIRPALHAAHVEALVLALRRCMDDTSVLVVHTMAQPSILPPSIAHGVDTHELDVDMLSWGGQSELIIATSRAIVQVHREPWTAEWVYCRTRRRPCLLTVRLRDAEAAARTLYLYG